MSKLKHAGKVVFEGNFKQCIAHLRSVGVDTSYELDGALIYGMPAEAPKPAKRRRAVRAELVQRTDADADYRYVGSVAAAKVWVDVKAPMTLFIKAKGGSVACALTLIYEEVAKYVS